MVGRDQGDAALGQDGVDDLADTCVDGFDGLDSGVEEAGVADHVAVGEIEDDHVILAGIDPLDGFGGDQQRAHLRLQVVGRNFRRRNQAAVLAGVFLLGAAIEEERDMRVFFGLGDAQLGQAQFGKCTRRRCCPGSPADRRPASPGYLSKVMSYWVIVT